MSQERQPAGHESRSIEPIYRPSGDGAIVVYAGHLVLAMGHDQHVVPGNLMLRLSPRPEFAAQIISSDWLAHVLGSPPPTVELPPGVVLDPPTNLVPSAPVEGAASEAYVSIPINRVTAGELRLAERLLLHVSGPLGRYQPSREAGSGEPTSPELPWSLSGWQLCLAEAGSPTAVDDFSFVVGGYPARPPARLRRHRAAL
jgi:hypothetical protein